jgi:hypothetical protein
MAAGAARISMRDQTTEIYILSPGLCVSVADGLLQYLNSVDFDFEVAFQKGGGAAAHHHAH